MRSSELFAPSGQADALPTFAVTAGSLAAYALFGWAPLRAVDRVRGSMTVYAVCCVALAAVYAVTSLPVLSDASGARAFLLVLRGFLGVTTLVSWFALLGDRPRLFQVSAIAVAFAATALADLAFLALQAAVGFALLVALPLLSLGAYRVVARKRSGAGAAAAAPAGAAADAAVGDAEPSRAASGGVARVLGSPILFCLLAGAVLGCIQGVGADLVLAHEQLAGGYVANNLLVAAALAIAAALVGGGAAFAHDGDDARLLAYARLTVIVALVLALCLANVLMMSGTFVSLTAAKLIGALLLAYAWFAACARPGARAVRALARMLVCWQVAAALLQAAVMAMAGEGPVQVVNVIVVILLGAVLVMQLFPLFLSSRPATFPTGPSNGQTRSQALSISADEADLALVERFADEYGLTPRERELLGFFAQGYSVAYASEQLVLSPYTVRTHLRNIYVKTDTHSRDDLLALLKTY